MLPNKSVLAVLLVVSAPALGQNLYQDIQREFADENQLQRDVRRYQHDIATGHYLRAAADRARIQNDESNIRYSLSDGAYEFRYTEKGWDLYKKQAKPPLPSTSSLPRNVAPRGLASTTNEGQASAKETVPPAPVPDPATPR